MMNIFFWVIVGFLILALLLVAFVIWKIGKRGLRPAQRAAIRYQWDHAEELLSKNHSFAVLEGDKVLDYALQQLRYPGTLGDKLKVAGPRFSDLNGIWSAHKLRNRIAHEMQYAPTEKECRSALDAFKRALHDLKAL